MSILSWCCQVMKYCQQRRISFIQLYHPFLSRQYIDIIKVLKCYCSCYEKGLAVVEEGYDWHACISYCLAKSLMIHTTSRDKNPLNSFLWRPSNVRADMYRWGCRLRSFYLITLISIKVRALHKNMSTNTQTYDKGDRLYHCMFGTLAHKNSISLMRI